MKASFPLRISTRLAYRAWFTPPPVPSKASTADLSGLRRFSLDLPGGRRTGFELGEGPLVLALHGWGGRSAQFADLSRMLSRDGYRVVVPDLPGGAGGARSDAKQVATVVDELVAAIGHPAAVVAHSFGALGARLAFESDPPTKVVMFAPMLTVADSLDGFADRLRLSPRVRRGLMNRLRRWDPVLFDRIASVDVDQFTGARMLLLHDPDDTWASFAASAELAVLRPGTDLVPLPGSGHNRILRDPEALAQVRSFLASEEIRTGGTNRSGAS